MLLKQDYKIQLANNKIQMDWLTCWLVLGKNKKQSVIKSNTADHSTTVAKPAQSPVPLINKRQPQDSNRQLTSSPPFPVLCP